MGESDLDRKLAQAASRSPELAAMLSGRHDDPAARYRRLLGVMLALAVLLGGGWIAAKVLGGAKGVARSAPGASHVEAVERAVAGVAVAGVKEVVRPEEPARPHEPATEIDRSTYLAPIATQAAGGGERVAPFQGFAVSVDSEPPGAVITVAGVLRGEAPVLASVSCRPGEKVEIRAERLGIPPVRRQTVCREDTLVKLTIPVGTSAVRR